MAVQHSRPTAFAAGNFITEIDGLDIHFIHVRSCSTTSLFIG
jgi:hypothetical protein